jgi:predicted nucleic acid-binding protein
VILLDTSGLLAALFADQKQHQACADVLRDSKGPFLLSPFILAELDYLVGKLAGVEAQLELLMEVAREAYVLVPFGARDVDEARMVIGKYRDQRIGLADASLVVLSGRYRTRDLLTLDERHFRLLRGAAGKPFRLLPANL